MNEPAKAQAALSRYTALTLGVGFSDTIGIDDAGWEELLAKLAPIEIQNPDALTLGTVPLPVGPVQLQASQIGPYLEATVPGESDLNRLNRHEVLWRAIVAKLAASNDPDILPGESNAGLGRYLRGAGGRHHELPDDAGDPRRRCRHVHHPGARAPGVHAPGGPVPAGADRGVAAVGAGARRRVRQPPGHRADPAARQGGSHDRRGRQRARVRSGDHHLDLQRGGRQAGGRVPPPGTRRQGHDRVRPGRRRRR